MSDLATRLRETSTRTRLLAGAAVIAVALAVGLMQSSAQIAGAFQAGGVFPQTILIDKTGDVVRIRPGEFATDQQITTFLKAYL